MLEVLSVMAVIGLLAGLLFPSLRAAQLAAGKARTRVQFSQWVAASEGFRAEYGYYPVFHDSHLVNPPGQVADPGTLHLFHDVLTARRRDGSALPAWDSSTNGQFPEAQNRKLLRFQTFANSDFTAANLLCDAFGNTEIAVLIDKDLDGSIKAGSDFDTLPLVGGIRPAELDFPASGVRAGIVFYAPAPGASVARPDFIFSWK